MVNGKWVKTVDSQTAIGEFINDWLVECIESESRSEDFKIIFNLSHLISVYYKSCTNLDIYRSDDEFKRFTWCNDNYLRYPKIGPDDYYTDCRHFDVIRKNYYDKYVIDGKLAECILELIKPSLKIVSLKFKRGDNAFYFNHLLKIWTYDSVNDEHYVFDVEGIEQWCNDEV